MRHFDVSTTCNGDDLSVRVLASGHASAAMAAALRRAAHEVAAEPDPTCDEYAVGVQFRDDATRVGGVVMLSVVSMRLTLDDPLPDDTDAAPPAEPAT